jgi:hypothetical protein
LSAGRSTVSPSLSFMTRSHCLVARTRASERVHPRRCWPRQNGRSHEPPTGAVDPELPVEGTRRTTAKRKLLGSVGHAIKQIQVPASRNAFTSCHFVFRRERNDFNSKPSLSKRRTNRPSFGCRSGRSLSSRTSRCGSASFGHWRMGPVPRLCANE